MQIVRVSPGSMSRAISYCRSCNAGNVSVLKDLDHELGIDHLSEERCRQSGHAPAPRTVSIIVPLILKDTTGILRDDLRVGTSTYNIFQGRCSPDLYEVQNVAHIVGWKP